MSLFSLIQIENNSFNLKNLWAFLGLNIIFRNNGNRRWRKHLSLPQIMLVQKVLLIVQKGITKRTGIHIGRNLSRRTEQKLSIPIYFRWNFLIYKPLFFVNYALYFNSSYQSREVFPVEQYTIDCECLAYLRAVLSCFRGQLLLFFS